MLGVITRKKKEIKQIRVRKNRQIAEGAIFQRISVHSPARCEDRRDIKGPRTSTLFLTLRRSARFLNDPANEKPSFSFERIFLESSVRSRTGPHMRIPTVPLLNAARICLQQVIGRARSSSDGSQSSGTCPRCRNVVANSRRAYRRAQSSRHKKEKKRRKEKRARKIVRLIHACLFTTRSGQFGSIPVKDL